MLVLVTIQHETANLGTINYKTARLSLSLDVRLYL
jgi:hypothetical protein